MGRGCPLRKEWYELMRKIVTVLIALLVISSLACPVWAAENQFMPSVSYKDGPELEKAEQKGVKLLLPIDTVVADGFPNPIDGPVEVETVSVDAIPDNKEGLELPGIACLEDK